MLPDSNCGNRGAGPARGRDANSPEQVPVRGWKDVVLRVWTAIGEDRVSLVAAGVGLFALLAAFPAMGAIISLYGLFASPAEVVAHLQTLGGIVPAQALEIFRSQLTDIADRQSGTLGLGAAAGLLVALWSARKGSVALMQACNVVYDEQESRGFFRRIGLSLVFTLGAVIYFLGILLIALVLPLVLEAVLGDSPLRDVLGWLRWPLLWVFVVLALAAIYRHAPSRSKARWRWVTWGAVFAASLWLAGSIAFAFYVRTLGDFSDTYGALGDVVVLLLWLYLTGLAVVLGAEVNAELEHQTTRDSTVGEEEPMGDRGAHVADTVGEAHD